MKKWRYEDKLDKKKLLYEQEIKYIYNYLKDIINFSLKKNKKKEKTLKKHK